MRASRFLWLLAVLCSLATALPHALAQEEASDVAIARAAADAEPGVVGWMVLSGELPDGPPPFAWVTEADAGSTLRSVLKQLRTVAADDKYQGVVISLNEPSMSLSQIDEISLAIKAVRDQGKRVIVYAEQYDMSSYALACSADTILLHRKGELMLSGLGAEEMYLAGLFQKLGIEADLLQVGKFKGADETFTRTGPSEAWSANMDALLDDLYGQLIHRIADGRGITVEQAEKAIGQSIAMSDEQFVKVGLVDALTDHDLHEATRGVFGDEVEFDEKMGIVDDASTPKVDNPFALFGMLFQPPQKGTDRQSIALINAAGPITSGQSSIGDGMFSSDSIGSRTMVDALTTARNDENIKGVVIRLDSPGGSAIASEMVWQAVRATAEVKPVYVTVGSMAASGGYYIACAADRIYVTPTSIVGSIGVVGGKIVLGGLYEKIGVSVHRRSRGPLGDIFNSVEKFNDDQRAVILASMQRVYDQFKDRVTIGRGDKIADVEAIAAGRIFTGNQAIEKGMADEIGGVHEAITAMASQLELEPGSYDIVSLPPAIGLGEFFEQLLGISGTHAPQPGVTVRVEMPLFEAARAAMGERTWQQVSRVTTGIMQLQHEPVLTLMPHVIVVK